MLLYIGPIGSEFVEYHTLIKSLCVHPCWWAGNVIDNGFVYVGF